MNRREFFKTGVGAALGSLLGLKPGPGATYESHVDLSDGNDWSLMFVNTPSPKPNPFYEQWLRSSREGIFGATRVHGKYFPPENNLSSIQSWVTFGSAPQSGTDVEVVIVDELHTMDGGIKLNLEEV